MLYRPAAAADLPAIEQLIAECDYYDTVAPEDLGGDWVVAEHSSGELVGCVWAFASPPCAYADYLCVTPKWRGTRVGARLVATLLKWLQSNKVKRVYAVTTSDNSAALRLYRAMGGSTEDNYTLCFKEL